MSSKMSKTKNDLLNKYSSMKKEFRKIKIIFDIEKLTFNALFDTFPLHKF